MIPKYLKLQNFMSHSFSEVDFDKFNLALVLGTYDGEIDCSNGAGKSALLSGIEWVLFDKSRHKRKDGVIKRDCRACRVEFEFYIDDTLYKITRTRDKIISQSDVVFEQFDGTNFNSIDCDTNTATDKKIVKTINVNYEVFINSVYFKQNDISMFTTSTPAKRKDVLKALLKIDKWDAYQKKANEKIKKIKTKIEEKEQHLVSAVDLEDELDKCQNTIKDLKKSLAHLNKKYNQGNRELVDKKIELQELATSSGDANKLKQLKKEATQAEKRLKEIKNLIEENNKTIASNSNKISSLQQKISIYKEVIKEKKKISIDLFRTKIIEGRTKKGLLYEVVSSLKQNVTLKDCCDLCRRPVTQSDITKIKKQRKEELVITQKKYKDICDKVAKAEKILDEKEKVVSKGIQAELDKGKAEANVLRLKSDIDVAMKNNNQLLLEKGILEKNNFKEQISKIEKRLSKGGDDEIKAEINSLEQELRRIKKNTDSLNIEYGSKSQRIEEVKQIIKNNTILETEINKLKDQLSIHDKVHKYFGKDGIQAVIIENVIEELENYANETLSKICNEPTDISIQTQKQNDSGKWVETFDILVKSGSITDDFESFSGGEQFRISLALRLALSNILSKRMGGEIKFLMLDEVSSNLDNKGLMMFIDIIKQLSQEFKILVITHSERLKDSFEDIIIVDKSANGSKARVI